MPTENLLTKVRGLPTLDAVVYESISNDNRTDVRFVRGETAAWERIEE